MLVRLVNRITRRFAITRVLTTATTCSSALVDGGCPCLVVAFQRVSAGCGIGCNAGWVETVIKAFVGSRTDRVLPGQTGSHHTSECEPVSRAEAVGRC